jgi:Lrp/AsnC family transcriptional regulator for asnA, asnC and gidA
MRNDVVSDAADRGRRAGPTVRTLKKVSTRAEATDDGESRLAVRSSARRTLADLDEHDRSIIRLLQEDGRVSNASIARTIGASEPTVRKRIERLVADQIIKVTAVVNPANSGYNVDILMGIRAEPGKAIHVGSQLGKFEQVLYLGYTTGRFDIIANMLFRSDDELFGFFSDTISQISGIVTTESFSVMRAERVDFDWKFSTEQSRKRSS